MKTEELQAFYDNLSALIADGKEEEAEVYLSHYLSRLPEALKNEALGLMFFEAIADEAEEIKGVEKIQKETLTAIQVLEALKKELEEGKRGDDT